jgi:proteasome lid subunit RPN8/RPN11
MSVWQRFFEELCPVVLKADALRHPAARATASLLCSGNYGGGQLISCRGNLTAPDACLLIVDLNIGIGQRPVLNDVRPIERVAIAFTHLDTLPHAYPLRDGFPENVPHFNLAPRGVPRSLCLFEMPAEEALRIATPFVLLERVRFWMVETAHGQLHGEDQSLEPMFESSHQVAVLPGTELKSEQSGVFYGLRRSDHPGFPAFLEPAECVAEEHRSDKGGFSAVILVTKSLPHARIRTLPRNVRELLENFDELGVDLLESLRAAFRDWLAKPALKTLLQHTCLIVIRTPIERSSGAIGGEAAKAFMTNGTAENLADKLGAFSTVGSHSAILLTTSPPDMSALQEMSLEAIDLYRPFDRGVAQAASGLGVERDYSSAITLVGAGAVGSQLAMSAARMGIGTWTIVDPDHLMPHNLARHALSQKYVGWAKVDAMAAEIVAMLGAGAAVPVFGRIDRGGDGNKALSGAQLVIDASASVPVARWLATASNHQARTVSVFLNPSGTDLVILWEGLAREPRLDHVEMSYYWLLANEPGVDGHFSGGGVGLYPSGGCRHPSLRLPQSQVGALASIGAKRILQDAPSLEGSIEIWRLSDEGMAVTRSSASRYRVRELDGWTVSVSDEVVQSIYAARQAAGSLETGGILVGTWDRVRQRAYIVGNYDPPPDSVSSQTGFVRGAMGVYKTLNAVETSTARNLTYVGEWHSHPPGHSSRPSADDRNLLRWIGDVLAYLDVPPLMAIGGEDGFRVLMGSSREDALFEYDSIGRAPGSGVGGH